MRTFRERDEDTAFRPADAVGACVVVAAALALRVPVYDHWVSLREEGLILQAAAEATRGTVPYRDVLLPHVAPIPLALLTTIFALVGPTLDVARLLVLAAFTATALATYALARLALAPPAATAASLLFVACAPWAFPVWHAVTGSAFGIAFAMLAVAVLTRGLPAPSLARVGVAAILGGLALLSEPLVGAAAILALVVLVVLFPPPEGALRGAAVTAGGVLAVGVATLLRFAVVGAVRGLVAQVVLAPLPPPGRPLGAMPAILTTLSHEASGAGGEPTSTAGWRIVVTLACGLPVAVLLAAAREWRTRRRRGEARAGRVALLVLATAFVLPLARPAGIEQLTALLGPTLILLALVATDGLAMLRPRARLVGSSLAWLAVTALLAVAAWLMNDLRRTTAYEVTLPGGRFHVTQDEALVFTDLARFVGRTLPAAAPLPVLPSHPFVPFMLGRDTGTSVHLVPPDARPGTLDARLIGDLARADARTVLFAFTPRADALAFERTAPDLFAYLVDRYAMGRLFAASSRGLVLAALALRAPAAPAEAHGYVLGDHLEDAVVTVTPAGGDGRTLTAAESREWLDEAVWPFRHVLALRPVQAPGETALNFVVRVPPEGRLHLAYGMNPDHWLAETPSALTFTVGLRDSAGAPATLLRARVDPQRNILDRAWRELDVELAAYAGQTITLGFGVSVEDPAGERPDLAGFADLRLLGVAPRATP